MVYSNILLSRDGSSQGRVPRCHPGLFRAAFSLCARKRRGNAKKTGLDPQLRPAYLSYGGLYSAVYRNGGGGWAGCIPCGATASPRRCTGGIRSRGEPGTRGAPVAAANRRGWVPGGVAAAGVCTHGGGSGSPAGAPDVYRAGSALRLHPVKISQYSHNSHVLVTCSSLSTALRFSSLGTVFHVSFYSFSLYSHIARSQHSPALVSRLRPAGGGVDVPRLGSKNPDKTKREKGRRPETQAISPGYTLFNSPAQRRHAISDVATQRTEDSCSRATRHRFIARV